MSHPDIDPNLISMSREELMDTANGYEKNTTNSVNYSTKS